MVDGQHLVSNAFAAKRTAPLLISGAVIHVLPAGSQFDLATRSLLVHQTVVPDPEVVEAVAAEADLREVARDIAAEGVSQPTTCVECAAIEVAEPSSGLKAQLAGSACRTDIASHLGVAEAISRNEIRRLVRS